MRVLFFGAFKIAVGPIAARDRTFTSYVLRRFAHRAILERAPEAVADVRVDYLRVAQGHVHWSEILRQLNVDLVVLDATGEQRQAADLVRASAEWRVTFDANGVLVAERIS